MTYRRLILGMTTTPNHIPIEYQPGSALRFQTDQDIVVHVIGQIHLPKDFLLARIYDVRFMKERDSIFNERLGKQIEIPHPRSYELETCAAQKRLHFGYLNSDEDPH